MKWIPRERVRVDRVALLACIALACALATTAAPATPTESARWHAHVAYLASDAMRGRWPGSPEHLRAARYVAAQFRALGLAPAGTAGSFLQQAPFASRRIEEPTSSVELVFADHAESLGLGADLIAGMGIDEPDSLLAPLVFAGYGLSVPEQGYDDLAHLDLTGKVVVYLNGAPAGVTEPRRTQAQSVGARWASFRAMGAVGVVGIRNPHRAEGTWEQRAAQRFGPELSLADPAADERRGERLALTANSATADKWLAGSGHTFAELLSLADSGRALPTFELAPRVRAHIRYERRAVSSPNVLAVLRGRDPALAGQFVVLSAHLDHLGVGTPVQGDSIFNGALDNASGVAELIEVARALAAKRPRRSVLFAVVTGEESGELGSYYWTRRPTVPLGQVVANLNVDMVLPIVPLAHLVVQGIDESTLGDAARAEGIATGIDAMPDPEPQRNRFIRSDQFSFIRAGIPALAFAAGAIAGSPEDSLLHAWIRTRYHQPSDDLAQPIDPGAPAAMIRYLAGLTARVANADARPEWKERSYFRTYARTGTN